MEGEKPKKNTNKLVAIIVAVVAVIGIVVAIVLLALSGGGGIKNLDDLKQAFKDKAAINCLLSKDDDSFTFQSTEGWDKVRIFGTVDHETSDLLILKDDAIYAVYKYDDEANEDTAVKMAYDADFVKAITEDIDQPNSAEDKKWSIECDSPSKADFSVPDKDWYDMTQSITLDHNWDDEEEEDDLDDPEDEWDDEEEDDEDEE
ncbi:hypothetical protein FWF93_01320 [Candidatus Saccharibacteria bacterium]|nr:hypothetical protein [Candidatus Saccharibacteria bacterium]